MKYRWLGKDKPVKGQRAPYCMLGPDEYYIELIKKCPNELTEEEIKSILYDDVDGWGKYRSHCNEKHIPLCQRLSPDIYEREQAKLDEFNLWQKLTKNWNHKKPKTPDPYLQYLIEKSPRVLTAEEQHTLLYRKDGKPRRFYYDTNDSNIPECGVAALPCIEKLIPVCSMPWTPEIIERESEFAHYLMYLPKCKNRPMTLDELWILEDTE